jgi:hypothetical protein
MTKKRKQQIEHDLPPGAHITAATSGKKIKPARTQSKPFDDTPKTFKRLMRQMQRPKSEGKSEKTKSAVNSLKIQPDETLRQFNERVNMSAMKDMATADDYGSRRREKVRERNQRLREKKRQKQEERAEDRRWIKDSSAPVNIRDIAQAPPENITVPKKVFATKLKANKKPALSLAEQKLLGEERQRAIDMYRSLKAKNISSK